MPEVVLGQETVKSLRGQTVPHSNSALELVAAPEGQTEAELQLVPQERQDSCWKKKPALILKVKHAGQFFRIRAPSSEFVAVRDVIMSSMAGRIKSSAMSITLTASTGSGQCHALTEEFWEQELSAGA